MKVAVSFSGSTIMLTHNGTKHREAEREPPIRCGVIVTDRKSIHLGLGRSSTTMALLNPSRSPRWRFWSLSQYLYGWVPPCPLRLVCCPPVPRRESVLPRSCAEFRFAKRLHVDVEAAGNGSLSTTSSLYSTQRQACKGTNPDLRLRDQNSAV